MMFGDMFDTPEDLINKDGTNLLPAAERKPRNCAYNLELPSLKRELKHFVGLRNLGATCYLNSLIQTLYLSPEFRNAIFSLPLCDSAGNMSNFVDSENKFKILFALQKLLAEMQMLDLRTISTEDMTKSFGWQNNQEYQQQDIQEAMRVFFDVLGRALSNTHLSNVILQNYRGIFVNHITCLKCNNVKEREEFFYDLMIQVRGYCNLEESLKSFITPEKLDGNNQYFCENCQSKADALKGVKIRSFPSILTFSLNRFCFDFENFDRIKINDNFAFGLEFLSSQFLEANENMSDDQKFKSNELNQYELFAVLLHRGDAHYGHYHTYARDVLNIGDWQDRMKVYEENKKKTNLNNNTNIIEEKIIEEVKIEEPIVVEKIEEETVTTKKKNNKKGKNNKETKKNNKKEDKKKETNEKSKKLEIIKDEVFDEIDFPIPFSNAELIKNWYDFNDSIVTAIPVNRLQKQFGGNSENAYILIYRRKDLEKEKVIPLIPDYLRTLIENQNILIEQERINYRKEERMIEIFIIEPNAINFEKNEFINEEKLNLENFKIKISIDDDLNNVFNQISFQKMCNSDNINLVEIFKHGNDLLQYKKKLDKTQKALKISDLNVEHFSYWLFFINDDIIQNKIENRIGIDSIPIKLTVFYDKKPYHIMELLSNKLIDLKQKIEDLLNIPSENQILRLLKEGASILLTSSSESNHETLKNLKIENTSDLYLAIKGEEELKSEYIKKEEDCFEDENLRSVLVDYDDSDGMQRFMVNLDWTLSELFIYIRERLKLDEKLEYRLKKLKGDSLFYEEELSKTLKELEFEEGGIRLRVEKGSFLKLGNISLTIILQSNLLVDKVQYNQKINIICLPNSTLNDLLNNICKQLNLEPSKHKLYQTDWLEEPIGVFNKPEKSLSINSIKNMDVIVLRDLDNLIPKEVIKFSIHLSLTGTPNDSQYIDNIQIKEEDTLLNLKIKILSMPYFQSFNNINPQKLRVREVKKDLFFGRVLRNEEKTIKKLNISSFSLVCQPLEYEEILSEDDIVILFRKRNVITGNYTDYVERVFPANKEPSIEELKEFTINSLELKFKPEEIELAKYISHDFNWLHLNKSFFEEIDKKKKNVKKKKKKSTKKNKIVIEKEKNIYNLRKMPYMLKDGDVIGYRLEIENPHKTDDFQTLEDQEMKLKIKEMKSINVPKKNKGGADSHAFQIFTDF